MRSKQLPRHAGRARCANRPRAGQVSSQARAFAFSILSLGNLYRRIFPVLSIALQSAVICNVVYIDSVHPPTHPTTRVVYIDSVHPPTHPTTRVAIQAKVPHLTLIFDSTNPAPFKSNEIRTVGEQARFHCVFSPLFWGALPHLPLCERAATLPLITVSSRPRCTVSLVFGCFCFTGQSLRRATALVRWRTTQRLAHPLLTSATRAGSSERLGLF